MSHYMKESEVSENRSVPAICPLMYACPKCKGVTQEVVCSTCEGTGKGICPQYRADQEEYKRLCKKWTEHAKSQEDEELEITSTKKGKTTKEKYSVDYVQEVTGTQVFHLEYIPTKGMSLQQQKELENKKKERFDLMCPHFKGDVLGLPTSDPAYHDCKIFSEWFYSKERG